VAVEDSIYLALLAEHTASEWRDLFARAGFTLTQIVPTKTPDSVIEAVVC